MKHLEGSCRKCELLIWFTHFFSYDPLNVENNHLSHIFMSALFRERLMHLPLISFLTEIWHLLDVSAVAEHGAVLTVLLIQEERL